MNANTSPGPVLEALGQVAYHFYKIKPLLPTYLHLLISAIFPIITASHSALSRPVSAAASRKPKRRDTDHESDEDSEEEKSPKIETITASDAVLFPLLAGATLGTLYLIIRWLEDPALLNKILGFYFSWIGVFFTYKFTKDILSFSRSVLFPLQYSSSGRLWRASTSAKAFSNVDSAGNITSRESPLPGILGQIPMPHVLSKTLWSFRNCLYMRALLRFSVSRKLGPIPTTKVKLRLDPVLDVSAAFVSLCILIVQNLPSPKTSEGDIRSPSWIITNLMGFSFCHGSLQFMTPGTFPVGTLLLCLLFFYDIYMVFYTPMMVTVATKLDVPIKLLFPKPVEGCPFPVGADKGSEKMEEYLRCLATKRTMAMLGLGDIVIPGMMIALALRFDLWKHYEAMRLKRKTDALNTMHSPNEKDKENNEKTDHRRKYRPARGSWGERIYTSSAHIRSHPDCRPLKAKFFPKHYFYASIVGYLTGMIATVLVMQIFQHAQPALLYLVPGVLTAVWSTAVAKGDVKTLWNYDETKEEELKPHKASPADSKLGTQEEKCGTSGVDDDQSRQTEQTDENEESAKQTVTTTTTESTAQEPLRWKNITFNAHSPINFSLSIPSRLVLSVKPIVTEKHVAEPSQTNKALSFDHPKSSFPLQSHSSGSTSSEDGQDPIPSSLMESAREDIIQEAKQGTVAAFTSSRVEDTEPPGKRRRKV